MSRNLDSGLKVYETDIANRVLLKNVVIALVTNSSNNYQELLDKFVQELPKGHRLIFVTPYDGREANDSNSVTVQTRQYELELAKKYDYVYIACLLYTSYTGDFEETYRRVLAGCQEWLERLED